MSSATQRRFPAFRGGELLRPLEEGEAFVVHARWESPAGYQAWLDAPIRAELNARDRAVRRRPDDEPPLHRVARNERRFAPRPTSAAPSPTSSTSPTDPATRRQEILTAKADTTPPDFERGVMNVLAKGGVAIGEIAFLAHGTTARDQRDHRAQGRQDRPDHDRRASATRSRSRAATGPTYFNLHYVKPPPFVPRYLRRELPGRHRPTTGASASRST